MFGSQKPAFAIFVRGVDKRHCPLLAAYSAPNFSSVHVNGTSVGAGSQFDPAATASACADGTANLVKLTYERHDSWVPCRSLGRQLFETVCPSGQTGKITYSHDYSCDANNGYEPGTFSPQVEVARACCNINPPQTEVRSDCPSGFTGTRTWTRSYSCSANADNEPGAWSPWSLVSNDCKADCILPWGGAIAHGSSVPAYEGTSYSSCASHVQTRVCSNGSLSGSFPYQGCTDIPPPPPPPPGPALCIVSASCENGWMSGILGEQCGWGCCSPIGPTSMGPC